MSANNITVTVAGRNGRGKSTVAETIRQALSLVGLNVELIDDNGIGIVDERPGVIASSLNERLNSIIEREAKIEIRTAHQRLKPAERS